MSSRFKVLLVDDNRALIEALSDILGMSGYETVTTYDGHAAAAQVRDEHFDCVLMDVRMPHVNGGGTFRTVRKLAPSTPVVLMTGYSWTGLFNDAVAEGNVRVMRKPVDPTTILDRCEKARTKSPLVMMDNDPDPMLLHELTQNGFDLVATTSPSRALTLAERCGVALLTRTIPSLRQSEVALLDPFDAKCAALLISEQTQPDMNSIVPAALTKPFKIDRLIALLENIRRRNSDQ